MEDVTMDANDTRFLRQLDIVSPEQLAFAITVIGAGAIGSATVLTLAKMGCSRITVWDDDILAEHNVPNQWCKPSAVGRPKVAALAELVWDLAQVRIHARNIIYCPTVMAGLIASLVKRFATGAPLPSEALIDAGHFRILAAQDVCAVGPSRLPCAAQ
jgi:tRNA A37 threonylcarbamoyladenosine dehydratase